jgi:hypothetical protein
MAYHNRSIKASRQVHQITRKKVNEKMALDGKYNAEWFNQTINNELNPEYLQGYQQEAYYE